VSPGEPRISASQDLTRTVLQVLFIGALVAGSFWILRPFLLASIWATTIAVATWPLMLRTQAWLGGRRGPAVAVMTAALLLVLVAPVSFAIVTIVDNADRIIGWSQGLAAFTPPPPPDWVERLPVAGSRLAAQWRQIAAAPREELAAHLRPYVVTAVRWFVFQVGGLGMMLVQFLLTTVIAAILFARGEAAASGVLRFARRLVGLHGEGVVRLAGQAIRAVALGVVVTAMVQSALGGIGLAVAGVPFPLILTAAMFLLAVAQVGAVPVLVLAVVWLYWKGDPVWGTVLLVWSILVGSLDNFLRPILIKKGADLPLLLIFAGVIGGLIAFGIIGLFIGPALLAVTYTLLAAWAGGEDQPAGPAAVPADRTEGSG
jgi:predicted PurR-regulated permease PerM